MSLVDTFYDLAFVEVAYCAFQDEKLRQFPVLVDVWVHSLLYLQEIIEEEVNASNLCKV